MTATSERRVRAIGGIFFRTPDPEATRAWYARHLGVTVGPYGADFEWRHADAPDRKGFTHWGTFDQDTAYFGSREQQFMVNFRVDDLDAVIASLKSEGVEVVGEIQIESFGRFAHLIDNDGRRVELWEPNDEEYEKVIDETTR